MVRAAIIDTSASVCQEETARRGSRLKPPANGSFVPFTIIPGGCTDTLMHMNRKILVIEDEPEMRRNLTTVLRLERFNPLPAENGRVGVELAKKEKPDLILCDVMMPELDGYGVIAALRADTETVAIPFIFLSSKGEHPDICAEMNLGVDDFLTKPVMKPDLLRAIRSRLEMKVSLP
jgi:CheY-like chemotaxis protein